MNSIHIKLNVNSLLTTIFQVHDFNSQYLFAFTQFRLLETIHMKKPFLI